MQILFNGTMYKYILIATVYLFCYSSLTGQTKSVPDYVLKKVVIDAGHGGKDPGAVGKIVYEKDVVLSIALKLGDLIKKNYKNVEVIYTRDKDIFIPLHKRSEIANKNKADLFISIHANAIENRPDVYGAETYTMGVNREKRNFEVAKKENAVITLEKDYTTTYQGYDPNSVESFIMFDLLSDNSQENSLRFASYVQDEMVEGNKRYDRGVKQDAFIVLILSSMPRVLVEVGYLTNKKEEKYLASKRGQKECANAIYKAFKKYKTDMERLSNFTTVERKPEAEAPDIYFKVQVATSQVDPRKDSVWYDRYPDFEYFKAGTSFKYTIKKERDYKKIVRIAKDVRTYFPGAFVVAVKEGKLIPVKQARKEMIGYDY
ncbi:MAG: N-acetylmuramoyl-L-alanine amidase [Bacteroidales bacterium]|nr:N-acetylmuramoyl-L-alanine amidase [Bacteroidales bacterium]